MSFERLLAAAAKTTPKTIPNAKPSPTLSNAAPMAMPSTMHTDRDKPEPGVLMRANIPESHLRSAGSGLLVETQLPLTRIFASEAPLATDREPIDDDEPGAVRARRGAQLIAPRERMDQENRVLETDAG